MSVGRLHAQARQRVQLELRHQLPLLSVQPQHRQVSVLSIELPVVNRVQHGLHGLHRLLPELVQLARLMWG